MGGQLAQIHELASKPLKLVLTHAQVVVVLFILVVAVVRVARGCSSLERSQAPIEVRQGRCAVIA